MLKTLVDIKPTRQLSWTYVRTSNTPDVCQYETGGVLSLKDTNADTPPNPPPTGEGATGAYRHGLGLCW